MACTFVCAFVPESEDSLRVIYTTVLDGLALCVPPVGVPDYSILPAFGATPDVEGDGDYLL